MKRISIQWPAERDDRLRELLAEGKSAGEVAIEMGITRNAVIGRASRLKLQLSTKKGGNSGVKRVREPRRQVKMIFHGRLYLKGRSQPLADDDESPPSKPCGLLELRDGLCRWPVTEGARIIGWENMRFCGAKIESILVEAGKPYCVAHCWMAYNR